MNSCSGLRKVVLIGPESTGKTWLAELLARHYSVPWAPEFAREFVGEVGRAVRLADVDTIGRGQRAGEDALWAQSKGKPVAILDTDLVSTMVYSQHYFGHCPNWIEIEAEKRLGDLYLLHHPDTEWSADGPQRQEPERRQELFRLFRTTLSSFGVRVAHIKGTWDRRKRQAIRAIDWLLDSQTY